MDPFEPVPDVVERVYEMAPSAKSKTLLWLLGGIGAAAAALVGFLIAIMIRVDQFTLHFLSTMPAILAVGAFVTAWTTSRSPREVSVGPRGVTLTFGDEPRFHDWDQIGWSTIQPGMNTHRRHLRLYDPEGRTIAKISDAIADFDDMAEQVKAHIAAKKDDVAEQLQRRKSKKAAVFFGSFGVVMLLGSVFMAWDTHENIRAKRLLTEAGVPGTAVIEDRRLAPNGVTPRLVYRMTAPSGESATRNVEVEREVWDALADVATIPVIFVPDEPAISRLAVGEVEDRNKIKTPQGGYGLAAGGGILSLVMILASILSWHGYDIDLDSKTGKMSIKRFGTGR